MPDKNSVCPGGSKSINLVKEKAFNLILFSPLFADPGRFLLQVKAYFFAPGIPADLRFNSRVVVPKETSSGRCGG